MKSKYTIEDIARYAEGLMEAEELLQFEAALQEDTELMQQLQLYKEVHQSLEKSVAAEEGEEKLKLTLQDMRKAFFDGNSSEKTAQTDSGGIVKSITSKIDDIKDTSSSQASAYRTKVVKMMWRKVAVVAAAAILIAVFIWQPWSRDLYTKYADTTMVSNVERGDHTDSLLQKATTAFNAKEYAAAAVYLFEVLEKEPDNSFAKFYYGVSLLQSGKTAMARQNFEQLSKGNSTFKHEAEFYLALSFLKEKDIDNCRKWLQQIPAGSGNFGKAKELLQKL